MSVLGDASSAIWWLISLGQPSAVVERLRGQDALKGPLTTVARLARERPASAKLQAKWIEDKESLALGRRERKLAAKLDVIVGQILAAENDRGAASLLSQAQRVAHRHVDRPWICLRLRQTVIAAWIIMAHVPFLRINDQNQWRYTPLVWAIESKETKFIPYLAFIAASPINVHYYDEIGQGPLYLAAAQCYTGTVKWLIALGADKEHRGRDGTPREAAGRLKETISRDCENTRTALGG